MSGRYFAIHSSHCVNALLILVAGLPRFSGMRLTSVAIVETLDTGKHSLPFLRLSWEMISSYCVIVKKEDGRIRHEEQHKYRLYQTGD